MADEAAKGALIRRRVLNGTVANTLGQVVTLLTGFFLTPFTLGQLGASAYGLWVLVGSVVAYGTLLDFGVSGAVIKYVAEYRARGDNAQASALVATALTLYSGLGALALLISAAVAPFFPDLFQVPPDQRETASWLVLLSGAVLAISIPCTTPSAVLRGLHRFDLLNVIGITGTLLAAGGTVAVLLLGGGVLGIVAINLPVLLLTQWLGIRLLHQAAPELHYGWRGARRELLRPVLGFSSTIFVAQVAGQIQTKTDELVIGAALPVSAVTPYAIARRLSEIPQLLTRQFIKVLLPLASELHAEDDHSRLRELFLTSTRLTLALFLPAGCVLLTLAGPVLTAWVGPQYAGGAPLVVILTLASFVDTILWPGGLVLQGMARPRPLALISAGSALLNLALSVALVGSLGVTGVALGTLIPTVLFTLAVGLPYTMRAVGVGAGEVLREVFLPTLGAALPATLLLLLLDHLFAPASLLAILPLAGAGALVYLGCYVLLGASRLEREIYLGLFRKFSAGLRARRA